MKEEKCPFCGEIMEKGFLVGGRGIFWWPDKPLPSLAWGDFGERIDPSASMFGWRGMSHLSAHRCKKCKIILIRAPEMEIKSQTKKIEQTLSSQVVEYIRNRKPNQQRGVCFSF